MNIKSITKVLKTESKNHPWEIVDDAFFLGFLRNGLTCLVSGADTMDLTVVGKEKVGSIGG